MRTICALRSAAQLGAKSATSSLCPSVSAPSRGPSVWRRSGMVEECRCRSDDLRLPAVTGESSPSGTRRNKPSPEIGPSHATKPEPDNSKVVIERIGKPNSCALHDRKTGAIDRRQFVQISASEVFPRPLQSQIAGRSFTVPGSMDGFLPRRHVSVSGQEMECLDDNGYGGVEFRARSVQ
jgi:hypothetical protein